MTTVELLLAADIRFWQMKYNDKVKELDELKGTDSFLVTIQSPTTIVEEVYSSLLPNKEE